MTSVTSIPLKVGDVIIVTINTERFLSAPKSVFDEFVLHTRETLQRFFPNNKICILNDVSIDIVSTEHL